MITLPGVENLREIYQSHYSIVYHGHHTATQQPVVVKILREEFPSLQNMARFNEEYEITNRYSLQGGRKAIARHKIQNRPVLVLEYIEGTSLRDHIAQKQRLGTAPFLRIAIAIAKVIEEIHSHRIIHKDVNPKNIILQEDGNVRIIDFGISTTISREIKSFTAPSQLEGTLAYISPEQTGRMNRSIDYRTDLYSLGVTFYHMITGTLPFTSADAMEIVHCHMAKMPLAPHQVIKEIPLPVSAVIMKLLAKNAEDRYQSASGLCADLEHCLARWQSSGNIADFELGQMDINDHFAIPEKLYGRESERHTLMSCFERVSKGSLEVMLVAGYSGIGKTALIHEIHQSITDKKGYFISGKFEQFQKDVPFSAIIHALKDFVGQLLAESPENIAGWKEKILSSVGNNGQLIADVVPGLELIIGKQPPLPEIGAAERKNRFQLVFQKFIADISRREHPLVIFIDDWQWADLASLNFLKLLITNLENQYLMVIGAYRDNEVETTHPFMQTINSIIKTGAIVNTVFLHELSCQHVNEMVVHTLNAEKEACFPLASLIHRKTAGNPFFVTQFFRALYDQGYIRFDKTERKWNWDLAAIDQLAITSNVIELMTQKIRGLAPATRQVLQLGACIGNYFPLSVLAELHGKNPRQTLDDLYEAMQEGLVIVSQGNYHSVDESTDAQVYFKFLHDRVEQAAYDMVEKQQRKRNHLQIGRIVLQTKSSQYIDEWLFDVVNYFNSAMELVEDPRERQLLAELNFKAGKKAKAATAYTEAAGYFVNAIELMGQDAWQMQYHRTFELHKELSECYYLSREGGKAEVLYTLLLEKAQSLLEKVQIYTLQAVHYHVEGHLEQAIEMEKAGLRLLNIQVPDAYYELDSAVQQEHSHTAELLKEHRVNELVDMPEMTDPHYRAMMELLCNLFMSAYISSRKSLLAYSIVKMTNLSLAHGNSVYASFAYVTYGLLNCTMLNNSKRGYKFGRLAIELADRYGNLALQAKVYHLFPSVINHWSRPIADSLPYLRKSLQFALEAGEFDYAAYAAFNLIHESIMAAKNLDELLEEAQSMNALIKRINPFAHSVVFEPGAMLPLLHLKGQTKSYYSFDTDQFSEEEFLQRFDQKVPLAVAWLYYNKIRAAVIFGFYEEGRPLLNHVAMILNHQTGLASTHNCIYYSCLLITGNYDRFSSEEKEIYISRLRLYMAQIKNYAQVCPANFQAKLSILKAELARIDGNVLTAMNLYDQAIALCSEKELMQHQGIVCELAARFYFALDKPDFAQLYLSKAYYAYKIWGATAKLRQMEEQYPALFSKKARSAQQLSTVQTIFTSSSTNSKAKGLDFQTIVKSLQTLSKEINLDSLLAAMMKILIENAGAEKGYFIQHRDGQFIVAALGKAGDQEVTLLEKQPLTGYRGLPASVIHFVARTRETLVLSHATRDKRFGQDAYLQQHRVKSLLCTPITQQGELKAIIYLENSLTSGAFTPERIEVLTLLSSQIAISVENALLYDQLEQKVEERTAQLKDALKELGKQNENTTASINYARRIQEAMLIEEELFQRHLKDSFILLRPRDIVSGDFYWFAKKDQKLIVAAVDCTGHGVPGSLMSMIGHSLLNNIVNDNAVTEADQILNLMHKGIRKTLKQANTENRDGMDMALCVIDMDKRTMEYAGAMNPLYLVQNGGFREIKADRKAIGGLQREQERIFTKHVIDISLPTTVYLCSDGFQDQFGGPERKKFMVARFRDLLYSIHDQSFTEQKNLLEKVLEEWMQTQKQMDDILVLGFKIG